jgi:ABC-type nitrate/sulfonate/bicarbonate transport system permease component
VLPLALLVSWYAASNYTSLASSVLLPPPTRVAAAALRLLKSGELLEHIEVSVRRVAIGMVIATGLAIPLGIFMGISRTSEMLVDGLVTLFRPIPPLAWVPLAILWFGIGNSTVVFITSMAGFFIILLNTLAGVKGVDRNLVLAARSLGARGATLVLKVVLPAAIPSMITGVRGALGISWMSIVAAELIAATSGLGYMITFYRDVLRTDVVIVGMVTIGILGIAMDYLLRWLERALVPWQPAKIGE